jgi:hypothetical protein
MTQLPETKVNWLAEIKIAYQDAKEAIPFGDNIQETDLYHMAPAICLKFRNLPKDRIQEVTESALSSYIATQEQLKDPFMAFAFCYLVSHFSLDLMTEEYVIEIIEYYE